MDDCVNSNSSMITDATEEEDEEGFRSIYIEIDADFYVIFVVAAAIVKSTDREVERYAMFLN